MMTTLLVKRARGLASISQVVLTLRVFESAKESKERKRNSKNERENPEERKEENFMGNLQAIEKKTVAEYERVRSTVGEKGHADYLV